MGADGPEIDLFIVTSSDQYTGTLLPDLDAVDVAIMGREILCVHGQAVRSRQRRWDAQVRRATHAA